MHMRTIVLCIGALGVSLSAAPKKLLIIETGNDPLYAYESLKLLSTSAGFDTTCVNFYDVPEQLDTYDAVFLLMSDHFFAYVYKTDYFTHTMDQLVAYAHTDKPKIVGLLFPPNTSGKEKTHTQATRVLSEFGLYPYSYMARLQSFWSRLWDTKLEPTQTFIKNFMEYMLQPLQPWATAYNTMLLYKDMERKKDPIAVPEPVAHMDSARVQTVPAETAALFGPLGMMISRGNTHFFISKMSWIDTNELSENFRVNPIESDMRQDLLRTVQSTLQQVGNLLDQQPHDASASHQELPIELSPAYSVSQQCAYQVQRRAAMRPLYTWADHNPINAAWLDLEPYKTSELLEQGVKSIVDARLNLLWISLNPENFFSPTIKGKVKQTTDFLHRVAQFTEELKKQCTARTQQLPHIFASFDITTNFRHEPVAHAVTDMFGEKLSKIPAPLDWENMWEPELLQPIRAFAQYWQHGYGNGLPLGGIFLDLEMYHAQDQAGEYTNMMDFGDHTWNVYTKQHPAVAHAPVKTAKQRVDYLIRHHKMGEYVTHLEQEAYAVGSKVRQEIRAVLPDAMIGVYTMTLPTSWFLRGFLAGLSTPEDPIILATFNSQAYRHMDYLKEHNIHCFHIPVVLLSKLRTAEDFSIIDRLRSQHDGVWFNRYSRLVEKLEKDDWWELETSPLERDTVAQGIGKSFARAASKK